jgi:hypothetical protein
MIVEQASHVAELEPDGHDAGKARQVLALLREALRNMLAHRAIMLRELP